MKEIKREVTTEQVVYEITKEELEKIKIEERNKGRYDIIAYIGFSLKNFQYKLNFGGASEFISDLADFISDRSNTIRNSYKYSFWDFIKQYR